MVGRGRRHDVDCRVGKCLPHVARKAGLASLHLADFLHPGTADVLVDVHDPEHLGIFALAKHFQVRRAAGSHSHHGHSQPVVRAGRLWTLFRLCPTSGAR